MSEHNVVAVDGEGSTAAPRQPWEEPVIVMEQSLIAQGQDGDADPFMGALSTS